MSLDTSKLVIGTLDWFWDTCCGVLLAEARSLATKSYGDTSSPSIVLPETWVHMLARLREIVE